tara:strand:+ start:236 stop:1450 length:1215 start_codon:yes stop_codon:yes gene_type:complete
VNLAFYIAGRYLFSAKSKNAVNALTAISIFGVAVGTLALVIVLSVFNGFEALIKSMYHDVSSDYVVRSVRSKTFSSSLFDKKKLRAIAPWKSIQEVCEEKVLLRQQKSEQIAKIRGVSHWPSSDSLPIEKHIIKGNGFRKQNVGSWALIGQSLSYTLSSSVGSLDKPLRVSIPNINTNPANFSQPPFKETFFYISGVYSVQPEYDATYILTSLTHVQDFLEKPDQLSSIEFQTSGKTYGAQEKLQDFFGNDFEVLNRYQQNEFLYKILKTEKWAIFLILAFILLIACFNIVGSVVMILLEKRKDIKSLWAMGASERFLNKIFFFEGILISFFGGGLGLIIGVSVCLLQQHFGWIQLGEKGDFIVNGYPVLVKVSDIILIGATLLCISLLITYIPIRILKRKILN